MPLNLCILGGCPLTRSPIFIACLLATTLALALAACGTHSRQQTQPPQQSAQPAADQPATPREQSTLITQVPTTTGLPAGSEFDFILTGDLKDPVFQASARVLYDSRAVEPVSAKRGTGLPASAVFLASVTAQSVQLSNTDRPATYDACVPFAFTGRPGDPALSSGKVELLRIRFRLKSPGNGAPVHLQNDPQFLQLRDTRGQRVAFNLVREVSE